jgi:hypothetical protein
MIQPLQTILNRFIRPTKSKVGNQNKFSESNAAPTTMEPILFELSIDKQEQVPESPVEEAPVEEDFHKQHPHHLTDAELQMLARKW